MPSGHSGIYTSLTDVTMADVFKSKESWRELIKSDGRGNYRLNID